MSEFIKYLKDNQHSPSCTRAEAFRLGQRSQQAEIDRLSSVLEERTKEWLQAIELGTYFENVAKLLREERDGLQGQVSEALDEIQRALNCCESTETACVLGELVKVLRGES